jgi:hypothetical protein
MTLTFPPSNPDTQEMKTVYHEVPLDDVLTYFAKGYSHKESGELWTHESFVDTSKRKVLFKLNFKDDEEVPDSAE